MFTFLLATGCVCNVNPLFTSTDTGYVTLKVISKRSLRVDLSERDIVILDAAPSSFAYSLTANNKRYDDITYPTRHLLLSGDTVNITSTSPDTVGLHAWLIPKGLCGNSSAALSSEYALTLHTRAKQHAGTFCIFSQTEFTESEMEFSVKTKDKDTTIEYYGADNGDEPIKTCTHSSKCEVEQKKPYFLRVKSNPKTAMAMKLKYKVDHPESDQVYCSVLPIPLMIRGKFMQYIEFMGKPDLKCKSKAMDSLETFRKTALFITMVIVALVILQVTGVVNVGEIIFPDPEKIRFDNLKTNPFATRIDEPNRNSDVGTQNDETPLTKQEEETV